MAINATYNKALLIVLAIAGTIPFELSRLHPG